MPDILAEYGTSEGCQNLLISMCNLRFRYRRTRRTNHHGRRNVTFSFPRPLKSDELSRKSSAVG
jgi:hypothetical protein